MSEIKRRQALREKEATRLLGEFFKKLKTDIRELLDAKKPRIETAETSNAKIVFIDGKPLIASLRDLMIPTLLFEKALKLLPKITVNMGAVPHICNGADLMAPGIVKIEANFNVSDLVLIVDEQHHKPLAIVTALVDSQTARTLQHGKVAKSIHYVGDSLWNQLKNA